MATIKATVHFLRQKYDEVGFAANVLQILVPDSGLGVVSENNIHKKIRAGTWLPDDALEITEDDVFFHL